MPDEAQETILTAKEGAPFQHVDPHSITVQRLFGWIFVGLLALIAISTLGVWAIVSIFNNSKDLFTIAILAIVSIVAIGSIGWLSYGWSQWEYDRLSWRLDEFGLEIRRGVWWRHRITIPRDRVQHTDVEQGPMMRRYGLAKLVIHTAGTHAPSIELSGLALNVAEELRDKLTLSGAPSNVR